MNNNVKENKLHIIQHVYSLERVNDYRKYCKNMNSDDEVCELYYLNELLSTYFFNLISNIEIALRNKIHKAINLYYESSTYASSKNNTKWYDYDEAKIVNIFKILKDSNNQLSNKIMEKLNNIESEKQKAQKNKNFSKVAYINKYKENILVSRLDFGFWNYIIANNVNYDFIKYIVKTNKNKDTPSNSAFLPFSNEVYKINMLRNRIAHHENIIKDVKNIEKHFNFCKNILHRICDNESEAYAYILSKPEIILHITFEDILKRIKNIHK